MSSLLLPWPLFTANHRHAADASVSAALPCDSLTGDLRFISTDLSVPCDSAKQSGRQSARSDQDLSNLPHLLTPSLPLHYIPRPRARHRRLLLLGLVLCMRRSSAGHLLSRQWLRRCAVNVVSCKHFMGDDPLTTDSPDPATIPSSSRNRILSCSSPRRSLCRTMILPKSLNFGDIIRSKSSGLMLSQARYDTH